MTVELQERRLVDLRNKISHNIASPDDYKEYENIVINSGSYTHDEIKAELKKFGYEGWDDYYNKRSPVLTRSNNKEEGIVLGFILGIGLASLLIWAMSKKSD